MEISGWFEKFRVADDVLAQSYETTPAAWRAAIKTGIAISHFSHGERDAVISKLHVSSRLGLSTQQTTTPVKNVLLFIGDDVTAAARICALAILPRLCGVEEIYAVIAGSPTQAALVALELSGIEDIFAASIQECGKLIEFATTLCGPFGRICFLHEGKLDKLVNSSSSLSCVVANMNSKPALLLHSPQNFDKPCLEFCQGKKIENKPSPERIWDAIFTAQCLDREQYVSRLFLYPGCEGFWRFQELSPDFYHENSCSVALTTNGHTALNY